MTTQPMQTADSQIAEREFYATQSVASDPGKYGYLFENLTRDFAVVSHVVQGLIYHYMAGPYIHGYRPPQERIAEIDTRYMERMLGRIVELDNRPLTEPRAFDKRLIGCCRDYSLLTCAILRHHGIPARLRYGFGSYFVPEYWIDHVIVEAWNGTRWQRFDSQVTDGSEKMDLPDTEFVTGGRALQLCHRAEADPAQFGLGPDAPDLRGMWFIRSRLLLDVAALNKQELLCWDQWGIGNSREDHLSGEQETLLEQVAARSVQGDVASLRDLTATTVGMRVPETVTCFSPAVGPHEVRV